MSFVANSLQIFQSKVRVVLLFFMIFWFFCALLLAIHTLSLKKDIKQQRGRDIHSALNGYLVLSGLPADLQVNPQRTPPDGLDFIRISSGRNQLLISASNRMVFTGLVELSPRIHGTWIDILHPDKPGDWILISKTLSNGSVIQAGKNDSTMGLAIYKRTVATAYLLFFLAILPSLCLAYLVSYIMKRPLQTLSIDLKYALEHKQGMLPKRSLQSHDLTEVHQLLEQTFSQNRQIISEMQSSLDNVAHDLRTPMTRLRAVAEYALQSNKEDSELYRSALSDCLEESERVLSMLKIMMSVAEAEAGTMRLNPEEIDLTATVKDVIGLYQYVAEEEQITVSRTSKISPLLVLADKTRISQVWANLLDNAIKYGHESGYVKISTEIKGTDAIICFYDDGIGISRNEIPRIWERLYRGDRSRSRQGLGLGLNYVKAVVEAHGGHVTVSSRIREGSCFKVRLPLVASGSAGKAKIAK